MTPDERMSEMESICSEIVQAARGLADATNGDDAYSYKEDIELATKRMDKLLSQNYDNDPVRPKDTSIQPTSSATREPQPHRFGGEPL